MKREFTVTTCILHEEKVLLLMHPKHNRWLPPGGHLDLNEIPSDGAKREVLEETGLEIEFMTPSPFWIQETTATSLVTPFVMFLENIPEHKGIPAHQHMDMIFLAKPKSPTSLMSSPEGLVMQWFDLEAIEALDPNTIFPETKTLITHLLSTIPLAT